MTRIRLLAPVVAPVVAAALVVGASYVTRSGTPPDPSAAAERAAPAGGPDRAELDRRIDLFSVRAAARGESLDHRTAGTLLLERAGLDATVDDYAAAADAFRAALEIAPDEPEALLGLGQASLGTHEFAAAADAADRLLSQDASSPGALALAADAAFARGAYDEAGDALTTLASNAADDPAVSVRLSQLALVRDGTDDARRHAEDALSSARQAGLGGADLAFYESFAGNQAYELGDYDQAVDLLERAVDRAPNDHGALGELARVRAATGDVAEAIDLLERANALVPEPDHLVLQGDLRTLTGDARGADRDYAAAVRLATRDADHERAWARALARYLLDHDGDLDRARRIVDGELAARRDAGAWDLDAWTHHRAGDPEEARAAIEVALELSPHDAGIWYHAGAISHAIGDSGRAVEELTTALELNPGFDPLGSRRAQELLDDLDPS
jgi:tetratricopeptide (TPR) repeat protein